MAYVAVSGGQEAIEESLSLLKLYRTEGGHSIEVGLLKESLNLLNITLFSVQSINSF